MTIVKSTSIITSAFLMLFVSSVQALSPIQGLYGGLMVGGSKAPDIEFNTVNLIQNQTGQGLISYSILGNIGAQLGYRMNHFRVEGQFLFNNNPYAHLNLNDTNIPNNNSNASTATQLRNIKVPPLPFTFDGYTNTYAGMLNGFYDFYSDEDSSMRLVPYVGVGVGYEQVQNIIRFFNNGALFRSYAQYSQQASGQAVVGLSYFLTDYTSFGLDFRYLSAFNSDTGSTQRTSFQNRPQIYSLNALFNASFNFA